MKLEYKCFGEACGRCQFAVGRNKTGCQDHRHIKAHDWTGKVRSIQIQIEAKRIVFKAVKTPKYCEWPPDPLTKGVVLGGDVLDLRDTGRRLPYPAGVERVLGTKKPIVRKVVKIPEINPQEIQP